MAHTHTRTCLVALCLGLPGSAGTRKVKPIWTLLKQETVSGSGISWAICKSAHCSRQITMPAPHHSVFYRPDALPAAQPTVLKHWRHMVYKWLALHSREITSLAPHPNSLIHWSKLFYNTVMTNGFYVPFCTNSSYSKTRTQFSL